MKFANDFRIVYITTNSMETATHISRILVSENLAACCTVLPTAVSFFSWADAINERYECMIMAKTSKELLPNLFDRVKQMHHDEVPEIISVEIKEAYQPYLDWMESNLSQSQVK